MSQIASPLVDFIIIGAMKCGTTSLYRHLAEHPDIDMSTDKETDFFVAEKNWPRGAEWYDKQFPRIRRIRGEASPNYTKCRDFPGVPARIARLCRDARLIYIVRDPVERAIAQFRHGFIHGAFDLDPDTFQQSSEYAHIMDASHYSRQLSAYLEHFPKEAVLVLDFDEFVRDAEGAQSVMDRVTAHVGAAPRQITDTAAQNESAQLSRIPAPVLRFAQSPAGKALAGLVGRSTRDRIRGALALGPQRTPPPFPQSLVDAMRRELAEDASAFRRMTGMDFATWSL